MSESISDPSLQSLPQTDVSQIANNPNWSGSIRSEHPEERKSRLRIEEAQKAHQHTLELDARNQNAIDSDHKRKLELETARHSRMVKNAGYTLAFIAVSFVLIAAVIVIFDDSFAAGSDAKKWAFTAITSVSTGLLGYITGKSEK